MPEDRRCAGLALRVSSPRAGPVVFNTSNGLSVTLRSNESAPSLDSGNTASGYGSIVSGGSSNIASGSKSSVSGGNGNSARGIHDARIAGAADPCSDP